MTANGSVLFVGDVDATLLRSVRPVLGDVGYGVHWVEDLEWLVQQPSVLVLGGHPASVLALLSILESRQVQAAVVVVTSELSPHLVLAAARLGVRELLATDQACEQLLPVLMTLLQPRTGRLLSSADAACSPVMDDISHLLKIAAGNDLNLLITGETGTGKEFAARQVHAASARAKGPFIPVNCAALPHELLESEFFGHAAGAYTGALRQRVGQLEAAAGGTLLLDEIGDLPLELQPKLLRFLEEKVFHRLGDATARKVDVRIMAATHQDLAQLVREGRFRQDLYYRLASLQVHLPPLRESRERLADLMDRLIDEFNRALYLNITGYTEQVLQQVLRHDWPGNIRELRNRVRLAALNVRSGLLVRLSLEQGLLQDMDAEVEL